MLLATEYSFTKEQLFADLKSDGIHVSCELLERAKKGSSEAFYEIGILYISKEENQGKILAWFLLSADQNNPEAQYHIGLMYHYGQNVPIDYLTAMEWYLKAAKQYHLRACLEIGYLYRNGYGVPANEHRAFQWFCKSKSMTRDRETTIEALIKESEEIVRIEKENKKTLDDLKALRLKQQDDMRKHSILSLEQELLNKDLTINILKKENQNIQNTHHQQKDAMLKQFEIEKQQILTQLDRSTQESSKKIQCLTQHNLSLVQKADTQDKVISQLRTENHNLQTLLKWYQEKENQYCSPNQTNTLQKPQTKANHDHTQVHHESKLLQEPDLGSSDKSNCNNNHSSNTPLLSEKEKQKMLDEIKSLKNNNAVFEKESRKMKKKIVMLETMNQSLRDSAEHMTKMIQHVEKSSQNWSDMVQDKQKIIDEIQLLKQSNVCLEQESKHMKEKIESLENAKHTDIKKALSLQQLNTKPVTQISEADEMTAILNELKQKDRKLKKVESQLQALQVLYEQKMFEAHEMLKAVSNQHEDTIQALEEENQKLADEVQAKMLCEKTLQGKSKIIESLQLEIQHLKQSRHLLNQEMFL